MLEADLVVTLGEAMRDEIVARGVPADKVLIVPNAVSEEFLRRPLPDATALRQDLRIKDEQYVVGVVSTLVPTRASAPCSRRPGCSPTVACRCGR